MTAELLDLARQAARSAGDLLLQRFHKPSAGIEAKSTPTDLVSDADRDAERLIVNLITKERPDDGIISEERPASSSTTGIDWVIDPLDGTVNFLFGIPWWAVSIAVEQQGKGIVGVIYAPCVEELFEARLGDGARLNGSAISVSDRGDLSTAMIGTGFAYDARARAVQADIVTRVLPRARDIRRAGSAALDLASLACGRLDGFYEAPMEHWDKAAGILVVGEAGGIVSELPAPYDLSPGVIAANPTLHPQLVELVAG